MEEIYLSSNLKYLRNRDNKTQEDIAKIIDKGASAVGNYENGLREPTAVDLGKLATFFNVSVDDLVFKDLRFKDNNVNPEDKIIMPVDTNKYKKVKKLQQIN